MHLWEVWNEIDFEHYRAVDPAFVSEMGWCAPPAWTTLRRAVPQGSLDLTNPGVRHHLRAADGELKLNRGLEENFGGAADPDGWHYLTQLLQARSQQSGTEWLRSRERCAGVVVWQLNDCWPVVSWAAVDGDEHLKPLWYALRRGFADRLLTLQPRHVAGADGASRPGDVAVFAVNDSPEQWDLAVTVRRVDLHGTELAGADVELGATAGGTACARLDDWIVVPDDPAAELLVVQDTEGRRSWWPFVKEARMTLPPPRFEVSVREVTDDAMVLDIAAASLLRDLIVYPDRAAHELGLDPAAAHVDEMMVSVLPGERISLTLTGLPGVGDVPEDRLTAVSSTSPVLRVLGDRHRPGASGLDGAAE
ncbi:MAG: hypothetical protein ACR2FV_15160 [Ornithinimicrobium sp.]|uniref:hypothetical protein n=1 Tax=Ornithinimicrobium sp. TaxID=1977084 RepID=UPI003D9AEE7F